MGILRHLRSVTCVEFIMSIGLMLEYVVPTKKSEVVPIATEEAFHKYWQ